MAASAGDGAHENAPVFISSVAVGGSPDIEKVSGSSMLSSLSDPFKVKIRVAKADAFLFPTGSSVGAALPCPNAEIVTEPFDALELNPNEVDAATPIVGA